MGFRFFRRIRIAPGVYVNIGKTGASVSIGPRGAKVTIGKRGVKSSVGIPGTGLRYETPYKSFQKPVTSGGGSVMSDDGGNDGWFSKSGLLSMFLTFIAVFSYKMCFGGDGNTVRVLFWLVAMLASGMGALAAFLHSLFSRSDDHDRINPSVTGVSTRKVTQWDMKIRDMLNASKALFAFLCELNRMTRCRNMLKQLPGLDNIKPYADTFAINDRLAVIVYCDAKDYFTRLGHVVTNLNNLEGIGYCALVLQLLNKGFDVGRLTDRSQCGQLSSIVEKLANEKCSIDIAGRASESRFAVIFGEQFHENEWVQRYATLMYRWASLIAKADRTVTQSESQTLDSIMKMWDDNKVDGNVRVTGNEEGLSNSFGSQMSNGERRRTVVDEDIAQPRAGLNTVLKKLDGLIGLEQVKNEIRQLTNFIEIQQKRRASGLKVAPITYHCVFTGNPGTGKTTVARIVAEIYREMGVVKKGHLVETDRSGLIAEYVGQTAIKTNKIIDSALDGVLFIDEAYSLVQGGETDFGREAISTLLKRMEDDRKRLVVILAGYTKEMKDFIDSNPGLQSRFNRYIDFPDYNAEELAQIFLMNAEKSQYTCDKDVRASIVDIMKSAVVAKDKNFGNARFVRNLFEKAIQRQATRLSTIAPLTPEMLSELTLHDLGYAYED